MTTTAPPALVAELEAEAEELDRLAADTHATPTDMAVVAGVHLEHLARLVRTAADVLGVAERLLADHHGTDKLERFEALRRLDGMEIWGEYSWATGGWAGAESDSDDTLEPVAYELCTFLAVPGERRLYHAGRHVTGADLIAAERERQADDEGFTDRHDDDHPAGALSTAAECYRWAALRSLAGDDDVDPGKPPPSWPWGPEWWKPGDVERDLVRAGALFQAEADRARRAGDETRAGLLEADVAELAAMLERHLLEP